mmetsp:Transcript_30015/g.79141  ORF Transcript_30015/g.79141 Transcript_30015/m.79141 type:complete len:193 (+) Transcript_30015:523-1101(+)
MRLGKWIVTLLACSDLNVCQTIFTPNLSADENSKLAQTSVFFPSKMSEPIDLFTANNNINSPSPCPPLCLPPGHTQTNTEKHSRAHTRTHRIQRARPPIRRTAITTAAQRRPQHSFDRCTTSTAAVAKPILKRRCGDCFQPGDDAAAPGSKVGEVVGTDGSDADATAAAAAASSCLLRRRRLPFFSPFESTL